MRTGPRTWHAFDEAVGVGVCNKHVLQHAASGAQVHGLGWREAAHAVAGEGVHAGLVESAPRLHLAPKLPGGITRLSSGLEVKHDINLSHQMRVQQREHQQI